MRELVQLPMKTTSTGMAEQRLAGFETHVVQRLRHANRAPADRRSCDGSGTAPLMGMPMPGLVPYVIIGSSASASMRDCRCRNVAPSSVGSCFQRATAASQSAPFGA